MCFKTVPLKDEGRYSLYWPSVFRNRELKLLYVGLLVLFLPRSLNYDSPLGGNFNYVTKKLVHLGSKATDPSPCIERVLKFYSVM